MEERNSKRARHRGGGGGGGGRDYPNFASDSMHGVGGGVGGGKPLAGCHLEVNVANTHLFPGQAVSVSVKLLNDEDVVQKITRDISVTVTGENNEVRPPSPLPVTAAAAVHRGRWWRCFVEIFDFLGTGSSVLCEKVCIAVTRTIVYTTCGMGPRGQEVVRRRHFHTLTGVKCL